MQDTAPALPIVDVAALSSPDATARAAVARAMRAACLDKGFIYVVGHGMDPALRAAVVGEARACFALPEAEKMAVHRKLSSCNRDYEPIRGQTLEAGAPPDLGESFHSGGELAPDDPRVLAGKLDHGPNQCSPAAPASARRWKPPKPPWAGSPSG